MAYTYDDWLKEQNKDSLSFKDVMKAGKDHKPPKVKTPGKGWQKDGGLFGKGGNVETSKGLGAAASAASAIADMSPTKHRGRVDAGTPVQQNEGGKKRGQTSETEYDKNSAMVDPEDEDYRKKKNQYGLE